MADIILVILLVALVAGYIIAVSKRKKREENQTELADEVAKNTELEQLKRSILWNGCVIDQISKSSHILSITRSITS